MMNNYNKVKEKIRGEEWVLMMVVAVGTGFLWSMCNFYERIGINLALSIFFMVCCFLLLLFDIYSYKLLDNNKWLLLMILINCFTILLIQDLFALTWAKFFLVLSCSLIYILLVCLGRSTTEKINDQRLILILIFTGASMTFASDFRSTIIVFGVILLVNNITTFVTNKVEKSAEKLLPFTTKYPFLNKILVYRYYYSVILFDLVTRITKDFFGKVVYAGFWLLFHMAITYYFGVPGLSLVISQLFANSLLASSISYYSLLQHPKIREHTEKQLDLPKRLLFTETMTRLFNQNTLKLLAFSGTFSVPWATYTWIKTYKEETKRWASERLSEMPEHIKNESPEWVAELKYMMQHGFNSDNYLPAITQWQAAILKPREKSEQTDIDFLKSQLQAKDNQLQAKDNQLQAKDNQLQAKDSQLQAKDSQLQAKDSQLQAKESLIKTLLKNKSERGSNFIDEGKEAARKDIDHMLGVDDSSIS